MSDFDTRASAPAGTAAAAAIDADTLGGRISRARDAMNYTTPQLARRIGVKSETLAAWESDRSEPRANRLTMIAGVLGVSPVWLLNGIGEPPVERGDDTCLPLIRAQLRKLKETQEQSAQIIASLEAEIERLSRAAEG